jgi:DNA polymerase-4
MFYVQVARLEDPEGAGLEELLIVGGSPSGRGVVTSASYPVREFGVHSGMPTAQALKLCPRAKVVPVSRRACASRSRRVREILQELSPVVQAASIDEFYLDISGTERLFRGESLEATARRIREAILERAEISVSIGGGTRKLVAKLAAGRAKPGGVLVVPPGSEEAFMRTFELREIPGIGPAFARDLERRGLIRVEDVLPVERSWLERWFGPSRAAWLWERVRARDRSRVLAVEPRKSISTERTFSHDLEDDGDLERELLKLADSLGGSLRRQGLQGRTITVKVRDADFTTRQAGHTLPDPVMTDSTIFSVARGLLGELRRKRMTGVRLLGIAISSLVEGDEASQLDLFESQAQGDTPRHRVVSRVLDDLRDRFGDDAIVPGRILEDPGGRVTSGKGQPGNDRKRPREERDDSRTR